MLQSMLLPRLRHDLSTEQQVLLPSIGKEHQPHTQNLELLVCAPPMPWSLYLQNEKTELVTLEAPPRLPCSVSFNLTNDIMVRGQAGATDSRTRQQDTILTTLLDNCTIS